MSFAKCMSPKEFREAYVELMIELDEYRLKEKELHAKLQCGYEDYQAGRTKDAADAFAKFRESHS